MAQLTNSWRITFEANGDRHILPTQDLRRHVNDVCCWCAPSLDPDDLDLIVHHAADERDRYGNKTRACN